MSDYEAKFLGKTKLLNGQVEGKLIETSDPKTGARVVHAIAIHTPAEKMWNEGNLSDAQLNQANDYLLTWERGNYPAALTQPNLESPLGSTRGIVVESESQMDARQRIREVHTLLDPRHSKVLWYCCGYCDDIEKVAWRLSYSRTELTNQLRAALQSMVDLSVDGKI